ncbi:hypothetical protein EYF80_001796 [Liparis tanakae]|uniref:Uncharacterized protein n=1 Tax=Liparis tanakae TaxID=230148 RepID=A0A4Z2JEY1_9TELE|nr:hypothetical protein EYF80_001796 [Liparis tanakae]
MTRDAEGGIDERKEVRKSGRRQGRVERGGEDQRKEVRMRERAFPREHRHRALLPPPPPPPPPPPEIAHTEQSPAITTFNFLLSTMMAATL